jgi:hypothetical protein
VLRTELRLMERMETWGSHKGVVNENEVEMGSVPSFVTAVIRSGPITATDFIRSGVCCQSVVKRLTVAVSMLCFSGPAAHTAAFCYATSEGVFH